MNILVVNKCKAGYNAPQKRSMQGKGDITIFNLKKYRGGQ